MSKDASQDIADLAAEPKAVQPAEAEEATPTPTEAEADAKADKALSQSDLEKVGDGQYMKD